MMNDNAQATDLARTALEVAVKIEGLTAALLEAPSARRFLALAAVLQPSNAAVHVPLARAAAECRRRLCSSRLAPEPGAAPGDVDALLALVERVMVAVVVLNRLWWPSWGAEGGERTNATLAAMSDANDALERQRHAFLLLPLEQRARALRLRVVAEGGELPTWVKRLRA